MIKFKEKLYVLPALGAGAILNTAMVGTTGLSMVQAHSQGKEAEKQAEESQRLQKQMNKQLAKIADSDDPNKGKQAAAVLQGQAFSEVASDIGEDASNGLKKAGNVVGGAAGTVTGGAVGSVLGGIGGMAGAGIANKIAGAKKVGVGKAGAIGAAAGLIGGSILGGQAGSSIFSQRSFAAGSELIKAGKGLLKVAGQHKGTIAESLGAGAVMAGTGYAANKALQSDEKNGTNNALGKIATIGAGTVLGGIALKKGANWGAFGKNANIMKRTGDALKIGGGFGTAMAAIPALTKSQQQQAMEEDTGGKQKKSGMGTATKVLLGTGLALGAAKGGHMAASKGWFGKPGITAAGKISGSIEKAKESVIRGIGNEKLVQGRRDFKNMKEAGSKYENPTWKESKGEYLLDKTTAFLGGGTQKTQRLADQLKGTDSKYLQKAGDFMKEHKKTALLAAAPLGYGATMGTWQAGEDITNKGLKKLDPEAFKEEEQ